MDKSRKHSNTHPRRLPSRVSVLHKLGLALGGNRMVFYFCLVDERIWKAKKLNTTVWAGIIVKMMLFLKKKLVTQLKSCWIWTHQFARLNFPIRILLRSAVIICQPTISRILLIKTQSREKTRGRATIHIKSWCVVIDDGKGGMKPTTMEWRAEEKEEYGVLRAEMRAATEVETDCSCGGGSNGWFRLSERSGEVVVNEDWRVSHGGCTAERVWCQ